MPEQHLTLRVDDNRLAYTVNEAANLIGVSRASIYRRMMTEVSPPRESGGGAWLSGTIFSSS
jgi:predicted DNA-binding transcriptional regulator AlpA